MCPGGTGAVEHGTLITEQRDFGGRLGHCSLSSKALIWRSEQACMIDGGYPHLVVLEHSTERKGRSLLKEESKPHHF